LAFVLSSKRTAGEGGRGGGGAADKPLAGIGSSHVRRVEETKVRRYRKADPTVINYMDLATYHSPLTVCRVNQSGVWTTSHFVNQPDVLPFALFSTSL
jgi:hypothetical protein